MKKSVVFLLAGGFLLILIAGVGILTQMMARPAPTPEMQRDAITAPFAMPTPAEWAALEQAAAAGDPVAMNNLGVAHWRLPGGKPEAQTWIERAAKAGDVAARYNLALILPDAFDTPADQIRQKLAFLQENVASGDVPSMVALAQMLYFTNRDAFVPDREGTIRSLLQQAAATGDPDYQFIYGNELSSQLRGGDDPALLADAFAALQAVFAAGDPRGAEAIGAILSNGNPDWDGAIAASGLETDPLVWYRRAGDLGLATARCHYGLQVFRTGDWINSPDMSLIERTFQAGPAVLGTPPETLDRALADLEFCASAPQRESLPNLPFGSPSLYAYKLRGGWTAMVTQAGWSNVTLGVLYGYGIAVPRDRDRALAYLKTAADTHDFAQARAIASALPDF